MPTMTPSGQTNPDSSLDAGAKSGLAGQQAAVRLGGPALRFLAAAAFKSDRFEAVSELDGAVVCKARGSDSEAMYRVGFEDSVPCVSLLMADRYLSQSIEQDLVHHGDKLADLLADELIDSAVVVPGGWPALAVDHFRDTKKRFTFRTLLPATVVTPASMQTAELATQGVVAQELERVVAVLLAYESCFARLGGMSGGEDGE